MPLPQVLKASDEVTPKKRLCLMNGGVRNRVSLHRGVRKKGINELAVAFRDEKGSAEPFGRKDYGSRLTEEMREEDLTKKQNLQDRG
jgi:hypothetical protein